MAFPEVVPALQRGVVDCALTGTLSGNLAGWPEVTKYLLPLNVGWSISYIGANTNSWEKFAAPIKDFFGTEFVKLENDMWAIGAKAAEQGVACNVGQEKLHPRQEGIDGTREDLCAGRGPCARSWCSDVVLVRWGKRCGKPCAEKWNDSVGKIVGLSIPVDKL